MIKLEGITKSFGSLQVLKGIDLEINKGEIVSIVGPSGAGKKVRLPCCRSWERWTNRMQVMYRLTEL